MTTYLQQLRNTRKDDDEPPEPISRPAHIFDNGWLIAAVSSIVAVLGFIYALTVTPIYEANTLIQVKRSAPLSGEVQADIPVATEVEILRSRSIISGVVGALQLDINVAPKRFPVVGAYIAAKNGKISEPGLFGYGGYTWGAEHARVSVLNVPDALLRQPLRLTIAEHKGFILDHEELGLAMKGTVGQLAESQTRFGPMEILVAEVHAKPGAQFLVSRAPKFQVVEQLQKSLSISENGKQSNVIGISLKGSNPQLITRILNEIGNEYIRQHLLQRSADAKKALALYDQQVKESTRGLQRIEARLTQVLHKHGISDLNEEARALAQQSVALQAELAQKEQRKTELTSRYLDRHPEIVTVTRQIQDIRRAMANIDARQNVLADVQREVLGLNREKQINSEIHVALLNTRHKLDALAQSNDVHVRLVDRAESPIRSVTLGLPVMIVMTCLLGIILGVVASIVKNAIFGPHKPPREVESARASTSGAGARHGGENDRAHEKSAEI